MGDMGRPVRTLSMTTGWLVRTSSYSVDIQRTFNGGEGAKGGSVWGCESGSRYSLASCDASLARVPEISQP
jgi:hypothetical protein